MTRTTWSIAACAGAALLIGGCSGSGNSAADFATDGKTFASANAEANSLIDNRITPNVGGPIADPPATAVYGGAATLTYGSAASGSIDAVGEINLQVNLAGGSVGGDISNLVNDRNERLGGSLNMVTDSGTLFTGDPPVTGLSFDGAEMNGTLTGGADGTLIVSGGTLDGEFGGPNARYVAGMFDAGVTSGTATLGGAAATLEGAYGAEQ